MAKIMLQNGSLDGIIVYDGKKFGAFGVVDGVHIYVTISPPVKGQEIPKEVIDLVRGAYTTSRYNPHIR